MPRVIRYQLAGRLGNQLFQWAFAHRISIESGRKIQFTVDKFHHPNGLKEYELGNLQCQHLTSPKSAELFGFLLVILDKLSYKAAKLLSTLGKNLYRESKNDPLASNISNKSSFITGYFIHRANVEKVEHIIRPEFCDILKVIYEDNWQVKLPLAYEAVHIRKGDFKNHKDTYGILSDKYYLDSVQGNLPLIVVTDFRDDSIELISLLKPKYIFDASNSTAWDALAIMSHAEILHISNSTLSWWGGFAAGEFGKRVFLPSPFYKSMSPKDSDDFFKLESFLRSNSSFD